MPPKPYFWVSALLKCISSKLDINFQSRILNQLVKQKVGRVMFVYAQQKCKQIGGF